ncbi:MAG: response regulator [Gammaproteobacteria bacterium]|nr:response regulator [Gammaproteobacteria bacterium]
MGASLAALRPVAILLVEDSPTDALLAKEAMKQARVANELYHVKDGVEAISFLRRQDRYANAPRPDLILLDLNLPKMDGRDVLAEIKSDPVLKVIPVVVLTTSQSEDDVMRAYGSHANCYITKPIDFDRFIEVVQAIEHFWFGIACLPQEAV